MTQPPIETLQKTGQARKAIVSAIFEIEFEDDGELDLVDQAHSEASGRFSGRELWDIAVVEILPIDGAPENSNASSEPQP